MPSASARLARRWLSSVAARLAHSQMRILHLLSGDLREQLAQLLLAEERDGAVLLPQETLAALLGARRPSVNKTLKDFEAGGLVALAYRRIRLLDHAGLERIAR